VKAIQATTITTPRRETPAEPRQQSRICRWRGRGCSRTSRSRARASRYLAGAVTDVLPAWNNPAGPGCDRPGIWPIISASSSVIIGFSLHVGAGCRPPSRPRAACTGVLQSRYPRGPGSPLDQHEPSWWAWSPRCLLASATFRERGAPASTGSDLASIHVGERSTSSPRPSFLLFAIFLHMHAVITSSSSRGSWRGCSISPFWWHCVGWGVAGIVVVLILRCPPRTRSAELRVRHRLKRTPGSRAAG